MPEQQVQHKPGLLAAVLCLRGTCSLIRASIHTQQGTHARAHRNAGSGACADELPPLQVAVQRGQRELVFWQDVLRVLWCSRQ